MGKDLTVIVKHTTATNKEKLGGGGGEGWREGEVLKRKETERRGDCDQYGSPYERSAAARATGDIASLNIKV